MIYSLELIEKKALVHFTCIVKEEISILILCVGILEDYTCQAQILRGNTAKNTPQKHIPLPAGELDNPTEASYSSVIQLTLAAQRSHCVIQWQVQYKRNAALKPKECKQFCRRNILSAGA